ncbi:MAG: caspase domain-containing protein [bacterium]
MWKTCLVIIFAGCLLLTGLIPAFGQEVHFYDNFEAGVFDQWELEPGWRVEHEEDNYFLSGEGHSWAQLQRGQDWTDYFFRHRLKLIRGGIHLNYRVSEAGRYFISFGEEGLYLHKESPWGEFIDLAGSDGRIALRVWHFIEIVGNGGHLQVYVDGILRIDFTDVEPLRQGNIAFETLEDSYAQVDDVEIAFSIREVFHKDVRDKDIPELTVDVDMNIPQTKMVNKDAIAVVIGNCNYQKTKEVKFAINDARAIRNYLIKTLGFKDGNIFFVENATQSDFRTYFGISGNHKGKLFNAVKKNKSDVFVFYSGHGAPGLKNQKGYFVPVECDPQYVEFGGYSLDTFYENISKIPAKSTTVVLDACFSGATVFENISPIVIKIEIPVMTLSNGVVLSSSSGNQVSSWYNEKKHSMFTYFFLKAIQNKNADFNKDEQVTFAEIYQYISDESEGVPYYARRIHGVEQNPTIEGKNKDRVFVKY